MESATQSRYVQAKAEAGTKAGDKLGGAIGSFLLLPSVCVRLFPRVGTRTTTDPGLGAEGENKSCNVQEYNSFPQSLHGHVEVKCSREVLERPSFPGSEIEAEYNNSQQPVAVPSFNCEEIAIAVGIPSHLLLMFSYLLVEHNQHSWHYPSRIV